MNDLLASEPDLHDPEQIRLALLRRKLVLTQRKFTLQRQNGLAFYRPHPKQDLFHRAGAKKFRYVRTGNRWGKALAWYEVVVTATGLKRISDVKEGDIVYDHDGRPTRVVGHFPQGEKELYRLHFDDNTHIDCCGEHKWTVKTSEERWTASDWKVKSTEELFFSKARDPVHAKYRAVIPVTKPVQFPERDLPLDPYVLGCLLGDGSMTQQTIRFTCFDSEIVNRIQLSLPDNAYLVEGKTRLGHFTISGNHELTAEGSTSNCPLPAILSALGLYGKDSYSKFVPSLYLFSSVEQRTALLQGLMDTDGSAGGMRAEYATCSADLAAAVQFLCQSLGYKCTASYRTTHDQNGTACNSYRLNVRRPSPDLFFLERKRKGITTKEPEKQRVIYKIERLKQKVSCFCIAVDSPLHTFLTTNFVVTHNSEAGSAEDSSFAIGHRPWYPVGDPARTAGIPNHPTKGVIITVDWDKATEIFTSQDSFHLGKLWKYIPSELVTSRGIHRNSMGHICTIALTNGSTISLDTVKSFKNSGLSQESSAWDWIHVDEPCPKEMFVSNVRGLVDRHGSAWFTCTPLTEMWINDYFIPSSRVKQDTNLPTIAAENRWMITGSIYDNPHNTKEAIDDFRSWLTHDEEQCRLHGKPLGMSGLIYKEFNYDEHVLTEVPYDWTDYDRPPLYACCRYAIDPHPRTPHAVLFVATLPTGHSIFYNEIFNDCYLPELAKKIKSRTAGYYIHRGIVDPRAKTRNPIDGVTEMDTLISCGLDLESAPKDLDGGILEARRTLASRDSKGKPWVYFSPSLKETLYEFDHYMWDPNKADKPIDKDDHMMENFYRLCLNGLTYYDPQEQMEIPRIRDIQQNFTHEDFQGSTADVDWQTDDKALDFLDIT